MDRQITSDLFDYSDVSVDGICCSGIKSASRLTRFLGKTVKELSYLIGRRFV
jgi:hypothetical protein